MPSLRPVAPDSVRRATGIESYGCAIMYVMQRTTIMLPRDLKNRATRRARERGLSLAELIREGLVMTLRPREPATRDPLFADDARYEGRCPRDYAVNHDRDLYGDHE